MSATRTGCGSAMSAVLAEAAGVDPDYAVAVDAATLATTGATAR